MSIHVLFEFAKLFIGVFICVCGYSIATALEEIRDILKSKKP